MKIARFIITIIFLIFFITSVSTVCAGAEYPIMINAENFPDEYFRDWILKQSYGLDGELSRPEIAGITSVRVINQKVSNLTGIELFTALKELRCSRNQLTILDLSKNTALKELHCSGNQLTTLDLSKNTALEYLSCDGNKLTTLDISKNTALTNLFCNNNQLITIDVSKNTALEYLDCTRNQLTTLDISKNTLLKKLYCSGNKLTTLDMSNNTALEYLNCDDNQLTTLDVSKNTTLKYLDCSSNKLTTLDVSKNTALEYLICGNNKLTTLDVSKNIALEYLIYDGNKFTTIAVSKNPALQYLNWNRILTTDDSQKRNSVINKNPDPAFARAVSNEAFPVNTRFFYTYILIRICPSFEPESQIVIGLKAGEQHAQVFFRQANITFNSAFKADDSDDVKTVVELMKIQKKDITIPKDVVLKWISDFWANLAAAVYQMRDNDPDVITLDGIMYSIEVYTGQNKITLDISGSDLSEKYSDYDITSMLDWISPIIKYIKGAISDNND